MLKFGYLSLLVCVLLAMCLLVPAFCRSSSSIICRRWAFTHHARIRVKRNNALITSVLSNALLLEGSQTRALSTTTRLTTPIGRKRKDASTRLGALPKYRVEDHGNSLLKTKRPRRHSSTSANSLDVSGFALWSSVATPLEDDDDDDDDGDPSPKSPHILQVKAYVTKNDGTAIGFYCYQPGTPDDEHLGGSAYFELNRSAFEAYYSAILSSLDYLRQNDRSIKSVTVQCDHDVVVHQLNGKYEIQRTSLRILYWKVMELKEACFDDLRFEFIPASANKEAGDFANKALGSKSLMNYHLEMTDPMQTADHVAPASLRERSIMGSRLSEANMAIDVTEETDEEPSEVLATTEENATKETKTTTTVPTKPMTASSEEKEAAVMDMLESIADDIEKEINATNHASISMPNGPSIHPNHTYILEFDGGSRGNPAGEAGAGMVLYDTGPSGNEKHEVWAGWDYLGRGEMTNNQAEYSGLIAGLEAALSRGIRKVQCLGDSNLVIKHISGEYRVRNAKLIPLWKRTKELLQEFDSYQMTHIRRHLNSRADALANLAMDNQESGSSD